MTVDVVSERISNHCERRTADAEEARVVVVGRLVVGRLAPSPVQLRRFELVQHGCVVREILRRVDRGLEEVVQRVLSTQHRARFLLFEIDRRKHRGERKQGKAISKRCKVDFRPRTSLRPRMNDGRTLRPREAGAPEARKRPRPTPELVAGPSKSQSSVISFEDTPRFIERYPAISLQLDEVLKEVELKLRQRFLRDSNARQVSPPFIYDCS